MTLTSPARLESISASTPGSLPPWPTRVPLNLVRQNSPEFSARYGSLSTAEFVTQLYRNVLDRDPDAGGLLFHVDNLEAGLPRNYLLVHFSESPENQANVIGAIQDGMTYVF